MDDWNQAQLGKTLPILCEGFDRYAECFFGRSFADSPEIDGKVFFTAPKGTRIGSFVPVRMTEVLDGDLVGELDGQ